MAARPATAVVASALRERYALSRPLGDVEILKLGLSLALGAQGRDVAAYSHSKEVLVCLPENAQGMSDSEWFSLFSLPRATNSKLAGELANSPAFGKHLVRLRSALFHTLQEENLRAAFEQPLCKTLVFLALNTSADGCAERVEAVIGSVIRTDRRNLEDLREEYASGACELMLLGEAVEAVISGLI